MSKRSDLLVACTLGNRWRASNATTGASCAASSPSLATEPNSRVHLETLWYSIKNNGAGTGLVHTVAVQVRGAANTVLATVEHIVGSTSSANVNISNFAFANPKKGTGLSVAMNTALASVSYAVNIAGWIEDTNG